MTNTDQNAADYKNLIDLMAVYAEASSRLTNMQGEVQSSFLEIVDERRKEYADLQSKIMEAEGAIEIIARDHPEWFQDARSIKTPYGTVKFHKSTVLEVDNEEASVLLIEKDGTKAEQAKYLRTDTKLNIEALENLTDAELERFRIKRVSTDNFGIKAGTIDLGKAVKKAAAAEDDIEEARRKV